MADPKPTVPTRTTRRIVARTKRRLWLLAAGATIAGLVAFAAAGAISLLAYAEITRPTTDVGSLSAPPRNGFDEPLTILALGSDTREGLSEEEQQKKGRPEELGAARTDTIILIHLDPGREQATMVHFPRDLRVEIPGHGLDKINAAYALGGPDLIVEAVREFSDLPIHHYIEVSFVGFQEIVDAIGGVEVCVPRPLFDELAELRVARAGCHEFDGDTALAYVRARNVEGDLIPDFARIGRQQQFVRALLDKVISPGLLLNLPSLVNEGVQNVTTDRELSVTDLLFIARKIKAVLSEDEERASRLDLRVVPSEPQTIDGVDYVIASQPETEKLFRAILLGQDIGDIGEVLGLEGPSPATISVRVLDAGAGSAAVEEAVDVLRRAGFIVEGSGEAPASQQETVILFRGGEEVRAETVLGYFNGLPTEKGFRASLMGADVALVLGPDYAGPSV